MVKDGQGGGIAAAGIADPRLFCVQHGQVVQDGGDLGMPVTEDGYLDPQGLLEVVEGLVGFIALMVEYGEIVVAHPDLVVVRAEPASPEAQRAVENKLSLLIVGQTDKDRAAHGGVGRYVGGREVAGLVAQATARRA